MVEILIVAVLVLWSTVVVFKKVFPKTANKTFGVLAEQTQKQGWNTVSKWLKPAPVAGCGGDPPAAETALCAVDMHALEIAKADDAPELGEGGSTALVATQIIASSKGVAGIKADTDPALVLHPRYDGGQLFERPPQVSALAGGILDHRRHA